MDDTKQSKAETIKQRTSLKSSCKTCYAKKIRCDRNFPCGRCARLKISCESRRRKPRSVPQGEPGFWDRLSRLESIVNTLGEQIEGHGPNDSIVSKPCREPTKEPNALDESTERRVNTSTMSIDSFIGQSLWGSLATEVYALREALEHECTPSNGDHTEPSGASSGRTAANDLMFRSPNSAASSKVFMRPDQRIKHSLFEAYCENVDRSFKILHLPSLRRFVEKGECYLGKTQSAPGNAALRATIWFAAVNSLSEMQCISLFGNSKSEQIEHFRRNAEIALAEADILITADLATLQALALYIAAVRSIDKTRRSWTLVTVAIRIARGMNLHHESPSRSLYQNELRRRLWHNLRLLDIFCTFDRGSEPLIGPDSYTTPMPRNINDSDFDEKSERIPEPTQPRLTEMSFGRLHFEAINVWQHLLTTSAPPPAMDIWQHRIQLVWQYGEHARKTCLHLCDQSNPFHRFMQSASRFTVCSMLLQAVRPEQDNSLVLLPRADNPEVLRIAVNCLKVGEEFQTDPQFQKWVWMVWLQWRALVVALAGLCSIRDTLLAAEAWVWVEAAYARYPRLIADASSGMLWRPMVRLCQKANMYKEHKSSATDLAGVTPQEHNILAGSPSNLTDMDIWETDALHVIQTMSQIDLADLGLTDSHLEMQTTNDGYGKIVNDMSLFMQEQDWIWLQDGFN